MEFIGPGAGSSTGDLLLSIPLAFVAGAVNAAAFRATGFFSANMTGNVSSLSDYGAMAQWATALTFGAIIVAFVLGSASAAGLMRLGTARAGVGRAFSRTIAIEGVLIAGIGIVAVLLPPHSITILAPGLGFLMGMQNGASTLLTNGRVRTTHVSGIATDIGTGLTTLMTRDIEHRAGTRSRLLLHGATLSAFLLGGLAGVIAYGAIGEVTFIATGAAVAAVAMTRVKL